MKLEKVIDIDSHIRYFENLAENNTVEQFNWLRKKPEVLDRIKLFYGDCFSLIAEGLNIIATKARGKEVTIFNDDFVFSGVKMAFNKLGKMALDAESYNELIARVMPTSASSVNFSASTLERFIFPSDDQYYDIMFCGSRELELNSDVIEPWTVLAFPLMKVTLNLNYATAETHVKTLFDFLRKAFHLEGFKDNREKLAEAYLGFQASILMETPPLSGQLKGMFVRLLFPNQDSYLDLGKTTNHLDFLNKSELISCYMECIFSWMSMRRADISMKNKPDWQKVGYPLGDRTKYLYVYPEFNYIDELNPDEYTRDFDQIITGPGGAYSIGEKTDINIVPLKLLEYSEIRAKTESLKFTVTHFKGWSGELHTQAELDYKISLNLGRFLGLEEAFIAKELVLPKGFDAPSW